MRQITQIEDALNGMKPNMAAIAKWRAKQVRAGSLPLCAPTELLGAGGIGGATDRVAGGHRASRRRCVFFFVCVCVSVTTQLTVVVVRRHCSSSRLRRAAQTSRASRSCVPRCLFCDATPPQLDEFTAGFAVITMRLKEMYQVGARRGARFESDFC